MMTRHQTIKHASNLLGHFNDTSKKLIEAQGSLYDATCTLTIARTTLEHKKRQIIVNTDPKDLGSNEAQRTTTVLDKCQEEIDDVNYKEALVAGFRQDVTCAEILINNLRYQRDCLKVIAACYSSDGIADEETCR
jgi:hypothetical protein